MTIKELAVAGNLAQNAKGEPVVTYDGFAMEGKMDGWRILAEVLNGKVNFYARSGNQHNGHLPAVEQTLLANFPAGTWLDGELTHKNWGKVQSLLTTSGYESANAVYQVFDLIAHRDIDARTLPYTKRRALLNAIFNDDWPADGPVGLVESFPATAAKHDELVAAGYEGSVLKRLDGHYASGRRGHGWIKVKADATEDVVVMGFEDGTDVGAVIFGQVKNGELVRRGTAKRKPNLIPTPDLMEWAGRVVEIKHNGQMKSGAFRHPRMLRIRDDKHPKEAVWSD